MPQSITWARFIGKSMRDHSLPLHIDSVSFCWIVQSFQAAVLVWMQWNHIIHCIQEAVCAWFMAPSVWVSIPSLQQWSQLCVGCLRWKELGSRLIISDSMALQRNAIWWMARLTQFLTEANYEKRNEWEHIQSEHVRMIIEGWYFVKYILCSLLAELVTRRQMDLY